MKQMHLPMSWDLEMSCACDWNLLELQQERKGFLLILPAVIRKTGIELRNCRNWERLTALLMGEREIVIWTLLVLNSKSWQRENIVTGVDKMSTPVFYLVELLRLLSFKRRK